jgi:hypothetical protein
MDQMSLPFGRRWEIPFARVSWVEDGVPVFLEIPAHCFDLDWPWWHPSTPWNTR